MFIHILSSAILRTIMQYAWLGRSLCRVSGPVSTVLGWVGQGTLAELKTRHWIRPSHVYFINVILRRAVDSRRCEWLFLMTALFTNTIQYNDDSKYSYENVPSHTHIVVELFSALFDLNSVEYGSYC